jgi:predicted metal-binding protein
LIDRITALALNCGFSYVGGLNVTAIKTREEVRGACAANKCKAYGASWSCPPACGSLAECEARLRVYKNGIILQTSGVLEDSLDYEAMEQIGLNHRENLRSFNKQLRERCSSEANAWGIDFLLLGAGACKRCETCSYPDAPCRFPADMFSSMEAYGMVVSDVCRDSGLPYYYGRGTLTYVGCVLF